MTTHNTAPIPENAHMPLADPALDAYYADKKLMWRNVTLIGICNIGWGVADTLVMPLVLMRLLDLGVRENIQGTISSVNGWALSFMVMYFSWKSDHTVTRFGRRRPWYFVSAPFIIGAMALFPVFNEARWVAILVGLVIVKMIFMDIVASTFSLLGIDCVRRDVLARANSVLGAAGGLVGFVIMQLAGRIIAVSEWFPFAVGAVIMTLTTLCAFGIKEPPIRHPTTEKFKIWSTFKVAALDKRIFWLMGGVALINSYLVMNSTWLWFWAKETLQLARGDIYQALSWAGLLSLVLAYPIGWIIDRWGGFRVVLLFWAGQVACFLWAMQVHDKTSLIILSLAMTVIGPLYAGADIMVYKSAPRQDIGSITSTNSCIRNAYRATLGFISGWAIYFCGHNYRVGFVMGIVMSTLAVMFFVIYRRLMHEQMGGNHIEH
ncbi:MAG: MFS transporter [bacterium]